MWGQVMCAAALELLEAYDLIKDLEDVSLEHDSTESVRLVDKQLSLGFRFGYVRHLKDARRVAELVPSVEDPFARCSFRSMYSWALVLGCFYREASDQARLLLEDATQYRVDVVVSHAQAILGYSLAGLGRFDEAHEQLYLARSAALALNDPFAEHNAYALTVRTMLEEGRAAEACALEPPDAFDSVKGMRGEVLGSRALALATLGRLREAVEIGTDAAESTRGVETKVLWPAIKTVVALKSRDSSLIECAEELVHIAFASGAVDILVCTYRSNPDLLSTLLTTPGCVERTLYAIDRAGDAEIAVAMGLKLADSLDPLSMLSVREREVYDLICAGVPTREIAGRLFIAEATVKAHLQNIFDKVGIRSRSALALNAAHERVRQATSTKTSG
jgi:DNA-binding NarL/FixJ family response regulator